MYTTSIYSSIYIYINVWIGSKRCPSPREQLSPRERTIEREIISTNKFNKEQNTEGEDFVESEVLDGVHACALHAAARCDWKSIIFMTPPPTPLGMPRCFTDYYLESMQLLRETCRGPGFSSVSAGSAGMSRCRTFILTQGKLTIPARIYPTDGHVSPREAQMLHVLICG